MRAWKQVGAGTVAYRMSRPRPPLRVSQRSTNVRLIHSACPLFRSRGHPTPSVRFRSDPTLPATLPTRIRRYGRRGSHKLEAARAARYSYRPSREKGREVPVENMNAETLGFEAGSVRLVKVELEALWIVRRRPSGAPRPSSLSRRKGRTLWGPWSSYKLV